MFMTLLRVLFNYSKSLYIFTIQNALLREVHIHYSCCSETISFIKHFLLNEARNSVLEHLPFLKIIFKAEVYGSKLAMESRFSCHVVFTIYGRSNVDTYNLSFDSLDGCHGSP